MSDKKGLFRKLMDGLFGKGEGNPYGSSASPPPVGRPKAVAQNSPLSQMVPGGDASRSRAQPREIPAFPSGAPMKRGIRLLWGQDGAKNPCFLLLFGEESGGTAEIRRRTEESSYRDFLIVRGKGGHFPSFEPLVIQNRTDYRTGQVTRRMFYKRDVAGSYWGNPDSAITDFTPLPRPLRLLAGSSMAEDVAQLQALNPVLPDFALRENPGAVLDLPRALAPYETLLVHLLSDLRLYQRQRALKRLYEKEPPASLWQYLLKRGSSELMAGIFLLLAKEGDRGILEEARAAAADPHRWCSEGYAGGIRRTAVMYLTCFDPPAKARRLRQMAKSLPELRMYPLHIDGKPVLLKDREGRQISAEAVGNPVPPQYMLEGARLRQCNMNGQLSAVHQYYDSAQRRYVSVPREGLYPAGAYCDGVKADRVAIKSVLQEGELYGDPRLLGRLSYYLDAPGLVYHLRENRQGKALRYFRRQLTRIFEGYAETDEAAYITAMTALFSGYSPADACCKFPGNFQFNYFIKAFLYPRFLFRPPGNRYAYMQTDQFAASEGRFEGHPEIWNRHLGAAAEIAGCSSVETILRAMYGMLSDPENRTRLREALSFEQLMLLAECPYPPLQTLGAEALAQRLLGGAGVDTTVLSRLMQGKNPAVSALAERCLRHFLGGFSAEDLAGLLNMPHPERWSGLILQRLSQLDGGAYMDFLYAVYDLDHGPSALEQETGAALSRDALLDGPLWNEEINRLLERSLENLEKLSAARKGTLWAFLLGQLREVRGRRSDPPEPGNRQLFLQTMLFYPPMEELYALLARREVADALAEAAAGAGASPSVTLCFLTAIQNRRIPSDREIRHILETGTPQMLHRLSELLWDCRPQLMGRNTTVLLLLEQEQQALQTLAKSAFQELYGSLQQDLHLMLLDSPYESAYGFGLAQLARLYGEAPIPRELLLPMLSHRAPAVKRFLGAHLSDSLSALRDHRDSDLFFYYAKVLLWQPNRFPESKAAVYEALPEFVSQYPDYRARVEAMLLSLGGSNVIQDSEQALVTLVKLQNTQAS